VRVAFAISALLFAPLRDVNAQSPSPLPEGENKKLVERICIDCHGAENFVKRRYDREGWDKVVGEMVEKGAKGTDEEFDKVVDYLVKNFGKQ
jgi:competence protein ComEA